MNSINRSSFRQKKFLKTTIMTIQFKQQNSSIKMRISNGRNGFDILKTLPYKITPPIIWNSKLQLTVNNLKLNIKLIEIKSIILEGVNNAILKNESVTKELVIRLYNGFINPQILVNESPLLIDYIDIFKMDKSLGLSTLPRLRTLKNWILKFDKTVKVSNIDINWVRRFADYSIEKNYSESTINKQVQLVKQILTFAENNNINIQRNTFNYRLKKESTITHALNEHELDLIFNLKDLSKGLNNSKKLFLIACTTGLRISDLKRINNLRIIDGFIHLTTQKTKQNIIVPINPKVEAFISEVKPITEQVFNRNIKRICKLAGINEMVDGYIRSKGNKRILGNYPKYMLISSHTGRRSFCTNLYGKLPTMVIMAITGHTTERSFLTYIKKPQRDFAEQLKEYYLEKDKGERRNT